MCNESVSKDPKYPEFKKSNDLLHGLISNMETSKAKFKLLQFNNVSLTDISDKCYAGWKGRRILKTDVRANSQYGFVCCH